MAGALYSVYAVAILVVALGGLVGVVLGTPNADGRSGWSLAFAAVTALFVLALVGEFLL